MCADKAYYKYRHYNWDDKWISFLYCLKRRKSLQLRLLAKTKYSTFYVLLKFLFVERTIEMTLCLLCEDKMITKVIHALRKLFLILDRNQKILGIAVGDVDNLAFFALSFYVFLQYYFHFFTSSVSFYSTLITYFCQGFIRF